MALDASKPVVILFGTSQRLKSLAGFKSVNVAGRGCPLVVHYWADLQSVLGLRSYGNITRTRNVSEYMLVLDLCLLDYCIKHFPLLK